jgi:hypothetical protein
MSARADFAGARYCAHKVTVRLKNLEFFQKPGGWCNRLRKATESNRRKPVPNGILPRVPSSIRPPEEIVSRGFGRRGMASLLALCGCSTQDVERLGIMLRPWKNLATGRLSDTDLKRREPHNLTRFAGGKQGTATRNRLFRSPYRLACSCQLSKCHLTGLEGSESNDPESQNNLNL